MRLFTVNSELLCPSGSSRFITTCHPIQPSKLVANDTYILKGGDYALDFVCCFAYLMAAGCSDQLHDGRIHSSPAGSGSGRTDFSAYYRQKDSSLTASHSSLIREKSFMDKDRIKGKMEDMGGRVKRQVGEWTGQHTASHACTLKDREPDA